MDTKEKINGVDAKNGGNKTARFCHFLHQHHPFFAYSERIFDYRFEYANGLDI